MPDARFTGSSPRAASPAGARRTERSDPAARFDLLQCDRAAIEADFGGALEWEREVGKRGARIKSEMESNLYDREQWPAMIEFVADRLIRLERATKARILSTGRQLKPIGAVPAVAYSEAD